MKITLVKYLFYTLKNVEDSKEIYDFNFTLNNIKDYKKNAYLYFQKKTTSFVTNNIVM